MPDYPPLSTRLIGETESALGALLAPLLAEAGITFPQWVVLVLTAAGGPAVDREQLIARIADARKIDPAETAKAITELRERGALATGDGQVTLTGEGRAVHGQIQARVEEITARLFDFPAEDLVTVGRVLATITARANSVLAGR
jgi:DNA-binding MarR family transcriptional regulator